MELYHEQYNTQWYDNCKNVLRVLCPNTDYLFLGQEDWYMGSQHIIAIQSSSVELHDHTKDIHIL